MLIAQEYLGKVGVGVTVPLFFRAHDGNKYVVKFHNNPISCRVLISELFAAKLGKIIGLCFPTSDLIVIKDPIIRSNCLVHNKKGQSCKRNSPLLQK